MQEWKKKPELSSARIIGEELELHLFQGCQSQLSAAFTLVPTFTCGLVKAPEFRYY
jgi:hypothetical protein